MCSKSSLQDSLISREFISACGRYGTRYMGIYDDLRGTDGVLWKPVLFHSWISWTLVFLWRPFNLACSGRYVMSNLSWYLTLFVRLSFCNFLLHGTHPGPSQILLFPVAPPGSLGVAYLEMSRPTEPLSRSGLHTWLWLTMMIDSTAHESQTIVKTEFKLEFFENRDNISSLLQRLWKP